MRLRPLITGLLLALSPSLGMAAGPQVAGPQVAEPELPAGYWDRPIPPQGQAPQHWPHPQGSLRPSDCGSCHVAQYRDWQGSLHAHAASPGLMGQFPGLGREEAAACLNCHAPLAEQGLPDQPDWLGLLERRSQDRQRAELPHAGVSCAACHVRGNARFGPPRRGETATGWIDGGAHGGFTALPAFETSEFCAACHQFPQSMAINGKPLENTLAEWRASRFARQGVTCQGCHMPERRHGFKGIHDPATVTSGLAFNLVVAPRAATLTLTSTGIGHYFPTYVTPAVEVVAEALGGEGTVVRQWRWTIQRRVSADSGRWEEIEDTRIAPGEARPFVAAPLPPGATAVRWTVTVEPDAFYKGVYRGLLAGALPDPARRLIEAAITRAEEGDYPLWQQVRAIPGR